MGRKTYKKVITSPELSARINPESMKLVKKFLQTKKARCSDLTVKGYASDLNIFLTWNLLHNDNIPFTDIRKIEFSDFFIFALSDLRWSSSRFGRVKSALSSFSDFIEKYFDDSYPSFRNVILRAVDSVPKQTVREKTILSDEQVESVFNYIENELEDFQMACWFALAIASGSRFSELLRFTTKNIDPTILAFEDIFIESLPIQTKGRGKNGKMISKYIIKDIFLSRYEKWLPIRKEILNRNGKDHDFLFIKHNGDIALASTARTWVQKIEDFLQIDVYTHCLRHFFTTYLAKAGLPIDLIQEIGGWSDVSMVGLYSDISAKDRKWEELKNLKNINKK